MDMNYRGGGMWDGGWAGWSGVKGGKWDNCNSIINKYIFFKKQKKYQKKKKGLKKQLLFSTSVLGLPKYKCIEHILYLLVTHMCMSKQYILLII